MKAKGVAERNQERERGIIIWARKDREEEKSNKEWRKKEEKETIISPSGQIGAEWILSHAISHLYANLHY